MTPLSSRDAARLLDAALPSPGQRILVAVSGGLDSICLMHLFAILAKQSRWELRVAHFHHGLRGADADADAQFVRRLSRSLGWPFSLGHGQVSARQAETGESVEAAARELRHRFLARTAVRFQADCIALAHHACDQAETVLIRLFRGAGGFGLGAMTATGRSPVDATVSLVRPLLHRTRAELETIARKQHWSWREDLSNADCRILRNRIRHELLPLLRRKYCPAIDTLLCRAAEITAADARLSANSAAQWLNSKRRPQFENLPLAIQRAVIRDQLQSLGVVAEFELTERLRTEPEAPHEVRMGRRLQRHLDGRVRAIPSTELNHSGRARCIDLMGRAGRILVNGRTLRWSIQGGNRLPSQAPGVEHFDADQVGNVLVLRHWKAGDRFRPLGFSTSTKLQDLFVNRKVPIADRRQRLVATAMSGDIFWVEGLPPGEQFKISGNTCRILTWKLSVPEEAVPTGETSSSAVSPKGDTPKNSLENRSGAVDRDRSHARSAQRQRKRDSSVDRTIAQSLAAAG
ncbi:MAG: tRNA lysidine(34) synthetase TilS [Pedosphaera sp.]|nr:tRNA lysidine(34) synthetase TilS [Pedosphaera sp.]